VAAYAISGHSKAGHLITQHGLTFAAYRALFPNAPQMPETERAGRPAVRVTLSSSGKFRMNEMISFAAMIGSIGGLRKTPIGGSFPFS